MIQFLKHRWKEIVIGILTITIISMAFAWNSSDNTELESIVQWQGSKIQELQNMVDNELRIVPEDFISTEHVKLWLVEQDYIANNTKWTLELAQRLQHEAFVDSLIIQYTVVRNKATGQIEYWPIVTIDRTIYFIEPMTHTLTQYITLNE